LRAEIAVADTDKIEAEFGDLLFTMMNLARHLHVDAESALRRSNAKFRARFATMERVSGGASQLKSMSAEDLERLWYAAKLEAQPASNLEATPAEIHD
jgi:XTP/dITP diphosphohydrolase/ATP diphosphatase